MAIVRKQVWGSAWICWVDADPSGVTTAPIGTLAFAVDGTAAWQNTDGGTTWAQIVGSGSLPTWSLADFASTGWNIAANWTGAVKFRVGETQSMTGMTFLWTGAAKTIRCSLWNLTGASRVTYVDVAAGAGPATVTATFAAAQTLSVGVDYAASTWESSGTRLQGVTYPTPSIPPRPFFLPPGKLVITSVVGYASGDAIPSAEGGDTYGITPTLA